MSVHSSIEWTDATWNPVRGCTKISPGCKHCYAETFAERFRGVKGHPYEQGFDLRLVPQKLTEPLAWRSPKLVFVNSMSDLFQPGVPDEYVEAVTGRDGKRQLAHFSSADETVRAAQRYVERASSRRCRYGAHLVGRQRRRSQLWTASDKASSTGSSKSALSIDRTAAGRSRRD